MGVMLENIEQVTPALLTRIFQERGLLAQGEVTAVQASLADGKHASLIAHLELAYSSPYADILPERMLLKISKPGEDKKQSEEAVNNQREVTFYAIRDLADTPSLPIPRCYGAGYSQETGGHYVLLEDLSITHAPNKRGEISPQFLQCQLVVASLAKIHAYWWGMAQNTTLLERPTEQSIQSALQKDREKWTRFRDFIGDRLSPERHAIFEGVGASLPSLLRERLTKEQPITLIHGEAHFGKVLYPEKAQSHDIAYILDWRNWRVDMGSCDMAYLLALHWYPERRARMEQDLLRYYYDRLLTYGVTGYTWDDCWYDYRLAVIRTLYVPVRQWASEEWAGIWWHNLERIFLAYQDLACDTLLA